MFISRLRGKILVGDAIDQLKTLPDASVHCCVTSPPYWGLRDYGTRRWFGGDPACDHDRDIEHGPHHPGQVEQSKWSNAKAAGSGQTATTNSCSKCGAWWGQLGQEPTPDEYIEHLVEVFREVRRVLRPDGTLWLNIGDSYANDGKWGGSTGGKHAAALHGNTAVGRARKFTGLKPKDLIGIPWRLALALQADGWWLRADNIWFKPNVMPESVRDRTTQAHEHVFHFAASSHYFYDCEAITEPVDEFAVTEDSPDVNPLHLMGLDVPSAPLPLALARRNKRNVWSVPTKPYRGAHFAVFPEMLPETCIKAGTSAGGCCSACGMPYERREGDWVQGCKCNNGLAVLSTVLDPFAGSGTTLAVAASLERAYIGIEINPEYAQLICGRLDPIEDRITEQLTAGEMLQGSDVLS